MLESFHLNLKVNKAKIACVVKKSTYIFKKTTLFLGVAIYRGSIMLILYCD